MEKYLVKLSKLVLNLQRNCQIREAVCSLSHLINLETSKVRDVNCNGKKRVYRVHLVDKVEV